MWGRIAVALALLAICWLGIGQGGRAILVCRLGVCSAPVVAQVPGPSLALFNSQPYYSCTNNRYVSPTGSSGNTGLTTGSPWDLFTAAAYAAPAGTCINLAAGTYTLTAAGGSPNITHGGTGPSKTGYVVWRCSVMPFSFSNGALQGEGQGCLIQNNAVNCCDFVISVSASFVMIEGLEIDGNTSIFSAFDTGDDLLIHHVWFLNNDVRGGGLSGYQPNGQDYLFILHNVAHDNSFGTVSGSFGSGISIYEPDQFTNYTPTPGNSDYWHSNTTGLTYDIVVAYNVSFHNYNPQAGTSNSDGEGIILDDWKHVQNACPASGTLTAAGFACPWAGNALIMGNVTYNNGGQGGIEESNTVNLGNITVTNNTSFTNAWDTHDTASFRGEFNINGAANIKTMNNIGYTVTQAGVNAACGCTNQSFIGQNQSGAVTNSGNVWQTNLAYPGSNLNFDGTTDTYPTAGGNHNLDGSDPKFVNLDTCGGGAANTNCAPNFALQGTSPAIGFGQAFDLWQQSGTVDAGACVSSLAHCP